MSTNQVITHWTRQNSFFFPINLPCNHNFMLVSPLIFRCAWMKCIGLFLMQCTCLRNAAGTTPFSKDITKEQPFIKVLLFLTSSSSPTPSQSPARTSGCTRLNNGLFVWRKFIGNIRLLLRQERLLHGGQDRRKSRNQMENYASSGQKCTCITQMCKVPPQKPESWWSKEQPIALYPHHSSLGILSTSPPWVKRQGFCGWTVTQGRPYRILSDLLSLSISAQFLICLCI